MSRSKYNNTRVAIDGIILDSKKEAARYQELKILFNIGQITNLEVHVPYELRVNGVKICKYIADFRYRDKDWPDRVIVEDVKGMKTREYELKKKLMLAVHGVHIVEI